MWVKFNHNACGFGFGYPEGTEAELSQKDAQRAIECGCAVPLKGIQVENTENKARPEKAVSVKPKR